MPRPSFIATRIAGVETYQFPEINRTYSLTRDPDNSYWFAEDRTQRTNRRNGYFHTRSLAVQHIMADASQFL